MGAFRVKPFDSCPNHPGVGAPGLQLLVVKVHAMFLTQLGWRRFYLFVAPHFEADPCASICIVLSSLAIPRVLKQHCRVGHT